MIFDVFPPVLKYLRSKKIKETEKSKTELKISDTPLKQGTNIDYDPNKGLIVETGYRQEETQKLIAPEDIKIIADGSYARIGNTFYPTSEENTKPEVKRWLDAKLEVIALDKIPEFFKRDLVFLKTKLEEVLTEKANAIEIINKPLKPKISVRKDEPEWLDFKIDYISDKYELSYEMIKKQKNEYVHLDDYKWVHIDNDIIKNTEMNLGKLGANRTTTGFRIPINQFFSLEEFIEQIGGIKEVTAEYQRFLEEITDTPLKLGANIDYDPNKGLIVETGYRQEETQKLIAPEDIKIIADGSYARIGNTFYPTSEENTKPEVKRWLDAKLEVIALDKIPEFFKRDLVFLKTKLEEVLTEKANAIEIINKPLKPKISVRKDEPEWLDFKIDYISDKYELSYEMIKKQKNEYVHLDDYKWVHIDNDIIKNTEMNLGKLGANRTTTGFRIPINQFFSLEEFIEQIGGIKEVTAEYQRFLEEITDFKTDEYFKLPEEIETCLTSNGIRLRPYQRAGIHWLVWLTNHYLHGILADDMGLGKTIQTIVTIRLAYEKEKTPRHTLIICPKSVIHFWSREIRRCYPQARLCEYVGASRNRLLFNDSETTIFITTYETVARASSYIHSIPFYFVVLDEATKIKNPDAQRTKVIKGINALHRIALSGTPIENRPAELWSLFDFLMKGHLGKSHKQFVNLFENPITSGNNESANTLSKRIRPFLLRRLKKDVAKDLPEKIELDEWVELTDEQKLLYRQIQDGAYQITNALQKGEIFNYKFSILPILTKLKQVCDHPAIINGKVEPLDGRSEKFDLVIDRVREIHNSGEQVVLFTHFLKTLDLLEIAFRSRGVKYIRLDGSTQDRQMYIDIFNQKKVDAALCSIQACGHGINLTAANHVIHVDRWWNPAVEDQATDRVHRIGQDKTVYVYRILTKGTLEEKIALILEKKRNISDMVIGSAVRQDMEWTREDLLEILKPLE